ncbi:MAG: ThiF family adenylyltransferase [Deltaproteobacteria bacterium]|nr:ThiF family adenylyltransferase [Deltaproteobacteria bacterium]
MEPWHKRRPQRLAAELQAVDSSGLRLRFEQYLGDIIGWRGTVEVDGRSHFVQVRYPPDYPVRPPWVRETESLTDEVVDDQASYHQMADGSLCLFAMGTGPDSWSPELTIRDVIARYVEFRRVANVQGHVDEHGLPLPNAPGLPLSKVLQLTPGQLQVLRLPGAWGWVQARGLGHGEAYVAARVEDSEKALMVDQDLRAWATARLVNEVLVVPWLSVECTRWKDLVPNLAAVDALVTEALPTQIGGNLFGCVLLVEASGKEVRLLLLERVRLSEGSRILLRHEVAVVDLPDRLFARVDGALPGREALARWRVVMVGLGSLGGSVAVHLAKAGVSQFTLFDPERLEPENVARHVAGIGALYLHKVSAVRALLYDRNPAVKVEAHASSPLSDGSAVASGAFAQLLAAPDTLLVVTAADESVERAVNELANIYGRPVIFGSVVGHAEQGRVQRVLPGETPCYECVALQQRRHPGRFFRAKDVALGGPPAMAGYRQPGIPGIGLDVDAVAIMTARVVLQTLARLGEGSPDYPDTEHHHLVWTSRPDEGFDHPLQVRWEPYERDPGCRICADTDAGEIPADAVDLSALVSRLSDPARLVLCEMPAITSPDIKEA